MGFKIGFKAVVQHKSGSSSDLVPCLIIVPKPSSSKGKEKRRRHPKDSEAESEESVDSKSLALQSKVKASNSLCP